MPWQRLVLPSFLAIPVLALLLGLGTWQLQRLEWKNGLLGEIATAQAAPPIAAPAAPPPFAHIFATGRLRPGVEAIVGLDVRGPVLGGSLIAVLDREGAPPLLVERGWVPMEGGAVERPDGLVTVTGYARYSDPRTPFAADDDAARRRFLNFDVPAIAAALGVPEAPPFALTVVRAGPAMGPSGFGAAPPPSRGPLPDAARGFPAPKNPHLGYAFTWFGLAAAWVAVFALWASRRMRSE